MKVGDQHYQTVWMEGSTVRMIHQNELPWHFRIHDCNRFNESCDAIRNMVVRGAGAIGATAGFAMAQAFLEAPSVDREAFHCHAKKTIESTRPTARNLFYAVEKVFLAGQESIESAVSEAHAIAAKDADDSRKIGYFGNKLFGRKMRILTHCNAGWLAFVDYGTALSPIYIAHQQGKEVLVYAGETRPRGQGARLTAWELQNEKIPHLVIPDTAVASLMAAGKVDMVITGADRIALNGDVANKIGTLDRAILAKHFKIPFYVAAPTTTIDPVCRNGKGIVIENRSQDEVLYQEGPDSEGNIRKIRVVSPGSEAWNPAFDVTPSSLITGIITEKGVISAHHRAIKALLNQSH